MLGETMLDSDMIAFLQLCVQIIGFCIIFWQLKSLIATNQSDAQTQLYAQSSNVRKLIVQYPELRKYFFENEKITRSHNNYERVRTIAELYANYLEHFIIQKPNLRKRDWDTWQKTVLDIYDSSPIIQETLSDKRIWYSEDLHDFIKKRGLN